MTGDLDLDRSSDGGGVRRRFYRGGTFAVGLAWLVAFLALPVYTSVVDPAPFSAGERVASLLFGLAFGAVGSGLMYAAAAGEFVEEEGTTKLVVGPVELEF